jgi:hypothetical protein
MTNSAPGLARFHILKRERKPGSDEVKKVLDFFVFFLYNNIQMKGSKKRFGPTAEVRFFKMSKMVGSLAKCLIIKIQKSA